MSLRSDIYTKSPPRARLALAAIAVASLLLAACNKPLGDFHDSDAGLTKADYEDIIGSAATPPDSSAVLEPEAPPIPDLMPALVAPVPPAGPENRLVSISVVDTVPIRDVLIELARAAEVDLELDPAIEGGIIFSAQNRPFIEVIDRISGMANLRYEYKGGILRIEIDRPYHATYKVEHLAAARSATSSVDIFTDVFSAVGDNSISNGSAARIEQVTENDFYGELATNVRQILTNSSPSEEIEEIQLASVQPTLDGEGEEITDAVAEPVEDFSINRQSGLLSVYATQRQHRLVQDYLRELIIRSSSQIVVEAKVLEVQLSDEFRSGVDWSVVVGLLGGNAGFLLNTGIANIPNNAPDLAQLSFVGGDVDAVVNLISEFGTTRTLANPRLSITNNEPAVLKVAQNQVYFTLEFETNTTQGVVTETVESTVNTVPIGLVMLVQPSIDLDTNRVTLSLRPTLSNIVDFVDDPAVSIESNNTVISQVPVVEVREFDSIVTARSGEVIILGGLMQETAQNNEAGLPGFQDIPWVGNAFKSNDDDREVRELVIFLRATIVPQPVPAPADIDLYNTFAIDPRPLTF